MAQYIINIAILVLLIYYYFTRQKISKEDIGKFLIHELKVLAGFILVGLIILLLLIIFKGRESINLFEFSQVFLEVFYLPYIFIKYVLFASRAWHGITGGKLTPKGNIVLSGDWLRSISAIIIVIFVVVIICFIIWHNLGK